jgi:hypothetical protein
LTSGPTYGTREHGDGGGVRPGRTVYKCGRFVVVCSCMARTTEIISGRAPRGTNARLARIAGELQKRRPGEEVGRADALRIALGRGILVLEEELGLGPMPPEEPTKTPATSAAKKGTKSPARKPAK